MFRASILVSVIVDLEFVAQLTRRIETLVLYISSQVVRQPSPHLRPPSCWKSSISRSVQFVRRPFASSMQPPSRILFLFRTRIAMCLLVASIAPSIAESSSLIWQSCRFSFFRVVFPTSAAHSFSVQSCGLIA